MKIVCDRCNVVYDKYEDTEIKFNIYEIQNNPEFHICPFCKSELITEFMIKFKRGRKKC